MRIVKAAIVLCLAWGALSAASHAQAVQTDFDRSFDFARLRTFDFAIQRRPLGDPLAQDPLNDGRIRAALESRLAAGGYAKAEGSRADFAIAYYVTTRNAFNVQDYGYGPPRWFGRRDIRVDQYQEGTLMVDIIDLNTRQLVWRGRATGTVELKGIEKKVNKSVEKLVNQFLKDIRKKG